jgi:hypothetical protein
MKGAGVEGIEGWKVQCGEIGSSEMEGAEWRVQG